MEIHINKLSRQPDEITLARQVKSPVVVLPFKWKGSMPWIEVSIDGLVYKLGLDTGAEANLMKAEFREKLKNYLSYEKMRSIRGVSNQVEKVHAAKLGQVEVGDVLCRPMKTLFTDMASINRNLAGARLDGILGFEFFRQFKVAIDFKAQQIALWPYKPNSIDFVASNKKTKRNNN